VTTVGLLLPVSRVTRRVTSSSGRGQLGFPSRPGSSTAVGTQTCRRRRTTTDVYIAHQRRHRYARRTTANRSPTDIRRAPVDPVGPGQLSLSTLLGPRLRLPSRVTAAYQPCQPKVRPSADRRRRLASGHHQRSTPIQFVVPLNRKSCRSTTASWVSRHIRVSCAAGHFGRRAIKGMPVPLPNRPSPVVPPRPTPYPPNRKWNTVEPEVWVQSVSDRGEVVVFLPRNSLQQLLPTLRSRCPPP